MLQTKIQAIVNVSSVKRRVSKEKIFRILVVFWEKIKISTTAVCWDPKNP